MIDLITVRALYNGQEIAFLLEWNDRFKNVTHQEASGGLDSLLKSVPAQEAKSPQETYPRIDLKAGFTGTLRDAVEVQFPVKVPEGAGRPHFLLGDKGKPVSLWQWRADLNEAAGGAGGKSPVIKMTAQGYREAPTVLPEASQNVTGQGEWKDGRWRVVLRRALKTADAANDVQFEPEKLIPIAVHALDGANSEHGLRMAVSSWYFLALETPVPMTAYLYAVLAVALAGGAEVFAIRAARRREPEGRLEPPSRQGDEHP
jgi:DMSO reductase family type II enzyme heme b subunit